MGGEREVGCFLVLQILLQPVFLLPILQIRLCYVGGGGILCCSRFGELVVAGDKDGEE